ncbi:hypothetical protein RJ639_034995 [Escallonia herrerae]|uniref:Uncharacterized protein n=1 Tax=Escallonia herrerae TaxID=1293975 RepID=A0AA88WXA5_9ASTE|nr:hypothetical protein RJ639_034995 [Escallonia herrerae]
MILFSYGRIHDITQEGSQDVAGHITIRIRSLFISTTINPFGFDNEFPPTFCHNHQPLWICSLRIDVEDLGTDKYYFVAEEIGRRVSSAAGTAAASPTATQTLGLVACGTGAGVSIFANKFPGVFAATCLSPGDALNTRSINNSNVLALSGMLENSAVNFAESIQHGGLPKLILVQVPYHTKPARKEFCKLVGSGRSDRPVSDPTQATLDPFGISAKHLTNRMLEQRVKIIKRRNPSIPVRTRTESLTQGIIERSRTIHIVWHLTQRQLAIIKAPSPACRHSPSTLSRLRSVPLPADFACERKSPEDSDVPEGKLAFLSIATMADVP